MEYKNKKKIKAIERKKKRGYMEYKNMKKIKNLKKEDKKSAKI